MLLVAIQLYSADTDHFHHHRTLYGQRWSSCSHLRDGPTLPTHLLPGQKTECPWPLPTTTYQNQSVPKPQGSASWMRLSTALHRFPSVNKPTCSLCLPPHPHPRGSLHTPTSLCHPIYNHCLSSAGSSYPSQLSFSPLITIRSNGEVTAISQIALTFSSLEP